MDVLIAIPILIAIIPGFISLILIAKTNSKLWIIALVGGGGWLIASILRLPILNALRGIDSELYILFAALLAGIFEETIRYLTTKKIIDVSNKRLAILNTLCLGLGWGLAEALIVYVIQVPISATILGYNWLAFLPGALERNIALLLHVVLSIIILYAVFSKVYFMIIAITIHTIVNITAIFIASLFTNPWIVEAFIALVIMLITILVILYKPYFPESVT